MFIAERTKKYFTGSAERGVTLVEIMIAVAVLSIGIMGIVGSFRYIAKAVQTSRAKTLAANLSQEQVEYLKNKSYYQIIPTTAPHYHPYYGSDLPYDPSYYPPKNISIGKNKFTRYTYIERVMSSSETLVSVPFDSLDTGLKKITVTTVWQLSGDWHKYSISNLVSNSVLSTSCGFYGTASDTDGNLLADVNVYTIGDGFYHGYTANDGKYAFAATPGSYTLVATHPGYYMQKSTTSFNTTSGNIYFQDFTLTPKSSGSVSGAVFINNHLLVSQVMASSVMVNGDDIEYAELFNPTTFPMNIGNATSRQVKLKYLGEEGAGYDIDDIDVVYISTYVPALNYYLIANASSFYILGQQVTADAYYSGSNSPPCSISGGLEDCIRDKDAGAVIITDSAGNYIDGVGWSDTGNGKFAPWSEGTPLSLPSGLDEGDQVVRMSSCGVLSSVYGRAYDSDENNLNFGYRNFLLTQGIIEYLPYSTGGGTKVVISGTPAYGAVISADDGLSASTIAYRVNDGGFSYATFTLVGIATGTWIVSITSGNFTLSLSSVSVLNQGQDVPVPDASTNPSWIIPNLNNNILVDSTDNGTVSGMVVDPNAVPLANILVNVEPAAEGLTNTDGYYYISVPSGTYSVIANPGSSFAPSYTSSIIEGVVVNSGELNAGNNFVLSGAGRITGYVCSYADSNPYPGVNISAFDLDSTLRGQNISESNGYFTILNLSTGDYTVEPQLSWGETSSPEYLSATLSTGETLFVGTFTITGAYGIIKGSVTASGGAITSGVLIVATTGTIAGSLPPFISSDVLSGTPYYMVSSLSDGSFELSVRTDASSTPFNVYAWYTTFSGDTPSTSKKSQVVSVAAGGRVTANFSW